VLKPIVATINDINQKTGEVRKTDPYSLSTDSGFTSGDPSFLTLDWFWMTINTPEVRRKLTDALSQTGITMDDWGAVPPAAKRFQ
jgi:hypothetical protein